MSFAITLAGCDRNDICDKPGFICAVAGTGTRGFNGDGKPALATELYLASAVRTGPDKLAYVMDYNNHRLRVIAKNGDMRTVAGNGEHALAIAGPALSSPLENPIDFAFAPDRTIYLVPLHDPRVLTVSSAGSIEVVAGTGEPGDDGDGGAALNARFTELTGVAVASDGRVFLSESAMHRIRVLHPGGIVTALTPSGTTPLVRPEGLALDGTSLYVADSKAHRVFRVDTESGATTTLAGTGVVGPEGDGGPAIDAQLAYPAGVAVGPDGRVYICDTFNHRVRRIEADGTIVTVAGNGSPAHAGDGGDALLASLYGPSRISIDAGRLFIADQISSVIRVVRLRD